MKRIGKKIILMLGIIMLTCVIQVTGQSKKLVNVKADDSNIEIGLESTYELNESISMLTMSGLYQFRSANSSIVSCSATSHDLDTSSFLWKHSVTLRGNSVGTTQIELYDPSTNNVVKKYTVSVYSYYAKLCIDETKDISLSTTVGGGYDVISDKPSNSNINYTGYSCITTNSYSRYYYNYKMSFSEAGIYNITFTHRQTNYPKTITILVENHDYSSSWISCEPSCIYEGEKTSICSKCGTRKYESIPAIGHHDWGTEYVEDKEATCTEKGQKSIHCEVCGAIKEGSQKEIAETGHRWNEGNVVKESSCNEEGEKEYTCEICGAKKIEEITKKDHEWSDEYTVDKEATCTEKGTKSIHCKVCGEIKEGSQKELLETGHKWNNGKVIKEASCSKVGEKEYVCETCGIRKTEEISQKDHSWLRDYTKDQEATCTEAGKKEYFCRNCGEIKTEEIAPTGHKWNINYTIDKKATCEHQGAKSIHCVNCNEIKDESTVIIPAYKHSKTEIRNAKKATYTSDGYTGDTYCKLCGKKLRSGKKIKKLVAKIPQKVTISKLTAGKKNFKVTYKKAKDAAKYQIQYSLNKNMKSAKVKTTKNLTYTVSNLKAKKVYYVRVKAINIQGKSGSWSQIKQVKTK